MRYYNRNIAYLLLLLAAIAAVIVTVETEGRSALTGQIDELRRQVLAGEWAAAELTARQVDHEWRRRRSLIILNNSLKDVELFEQTLVQVEAYIATGDRAAAAAQASLLSTIWTGFDG